MKKTFCRGLALLLVLATVFSFVGCGKKGAVKELIAEFEAACNVLDLNAMMDCLTPNISKTVNLAGDLIGLFTDLDTEALLDKLAALLTSEKGWSGKEFFSSIRIKVEDVAVTETDASAMATISYTMFGKAHEKDATFKCVFENERWYIAGVSFR